MSDKDRERERLPSMPAHVARLMRGWAPYRGQRNCRACGHWLPKTWTAELCQSCQDKATPGSVQSAD